jgi:hypothetical protein
LAWCIVLWIVRFGIALGRVRCLSTLKEGGALCQNRLESVNVLLCDRVGSLSKRRELNPCEGTAVGTHVPSWDQVAVGRLVVDLGGRREGEIELWRQVQVEVKVFFGCLVLAACVAEVGEW